MDNQTSPSFSDDIGTYRALLARVIELHQEEIAVSCLLKEASFWGVAVRVLRKKLAAEGIQIPQISTELKSRQLQSDTLQALYLRQSLDLIRFCLE